MRKPKFFVPALCLASALTAGSGQAADFNVALGNWEDGSSWTPAVAPGISDTAVLGNGGTVLLNADRTIGQMDVNASGGIIRGIGGVRTLVVDGGAPSTLGDAAGTTSLTLDGAVLSRSFGSAIIGLGTLTLANGGGFSADAVVQLSTANVSRSVTGTGSFSLLPGFGGLEVIGGDQTFSIGAGVVFASSAALNVAQGTFDVASLSSSMGDVIDFGAATIGIFRNSGTMALGTLTVTATTVGGPDLFENAGGATMTQGDGTSLTFGSSGYSINNAGALNLGSGATVTIGPGLTLTSGGTLNFNGLASLVNNGTVTASGSVTGSLLASSGSGSVTLGGAVTPGGVSVGTMAFSSTGTLAINGPLTIDITGGAADSISGGAITLGGGSVLTINQTGAAPGGPFSILSGTSLSGVFSNVGDLGTLSGFTVDYTGTGVTLTAVPEPQFYAVAVGAGLLGFTVWRRAQKRARV